MSTNQTRRRFIQTAAAGGAMLGLGAFPLGARAQDARPARRLNLLILGGTAFLGPAIVDAALARGHTISLFHRGKTNPDIFPDLIHFKGDRDPEVGEGLKALETGEWDAVLDTSGYFPRAVKASAELLADRVGQYVFISSISVYDERALKPGLTEEAPLGTMEDETIEEVTGQSYGPLKALCEQAASAAMDGRVTNIRPGFIVGPRDRAVNRFPTWVTRAATRQEIICPGSPDDSVQLIDARDIGDFCIRCIENRIMGPFNLVGPGEPLTCEGMVDGICAGVDNEPTRTWISTEFLEEKRLVGAFVPWLPSTGPYAGFGAVKGEKAIAAGLRFRNLETTARDTWQWLETKPEPQTEGLDRVLDRFGEDDVLKAWHERKKTRARSDDQSGG